MEKTVLIEASNRHVHLSEEDLGALFGKGSELTFKKKLGGGQFAAEETVTLTGPKGSIQGVRVLGPARGETQIEVLRSDCIRLGIDAPVSISGDLSRAASVVLEGPAGKVNAPGCIIAQRHIHIGDTVARQYEVDEEHPVRVRIDGGRFNGARALVLENTAIRVIPDSLQPAVLHIDLEEANAAGVATGDGALIL